MGKILQPLGIAAFLMFVVEAHAAESGIGLRLDRAMQTPPLDDKERLPVFVEADELRGKHEQEVEARGNVRLRTRARAVAADWLFYDQRSEEVEAVGNVVIEHGVDVVEGTRLKLNIETEQGFMKQPKFRLGEQNARGEAHEFLFVGKNRYRSERTSYTTCGPGQDDWFIRAGELDIDKNTEVGTAHDATVEFLGTTILYTPWIDFSLSDARKSGFLSPTFATSGKSGLEFSIPYYWNIAPNRDATITPHVLAKRGLMVGSQFRYLERSYTGELRLEALPNDRQANDDTRWAAFLRHNQTWGPWALAVNVQKVSDDNYFRDLSTQIQATSTTLLPREATLLRGGTLGSSGNWAFTGMMQRWQTLQDPQAPITPPYDRLPQLTLTTNSYDVLGTDVGFIGNYVDFHHPTLVTGRRMVAYPSVSLPLQTSFAYVMPKAGVHYTRYDLDPSATTAIRDADRTVPIASTEAGLIMERDTLIKGKTFLNTLEPKIYYVYIPTRNQNSLPNFDTAVSDINFASIYAENQFSGQDRINDANQLTMGVTSRLLDPETGIEQLRVGVAQRYYFKNQEVTLPGQVPRTSSSSDILAALSGRVAPHVIAEAGVQYDTEFSQTNKLAVGARYQPDFGKVLNAGYRFIRNTLENVDVSAQWPIYRGWIGVGRANYSLMDRRIAEGLAGFEYNGGCWVLRVVTSTVAVGKGDSSRSIYVQLELNGVARVGSNPLDVLKQNIAGYTKINEKQTNGLPPSRW